MRLCLDQPVHGHVCNFILILQQYILNLFIELIVLAGRRTQIVAVFVVLCLYTQHVPNTPPPYLQE